MPPLEPFSSQSTTFNDNDNMDNNYQNNIINNRNKDNKDNIDNKDNKVDKDDKNNNDYKDDQSVFTKYDVPKITEIRKIFPNKYFQSSVLKSFQFVIWDLSIVTILFASYLYIDSNPNIPLFLKNFIVLPIYTFSQGTMLWSIFVLGHDCGHGSFSKYSLLNDTVGTFLHTLLLVPYTNWKLSHRHHHKNTSNIDKDEVFFPLKKSEKQEKMPSSEVIPYFGLGFGWLTYLLIGYGPRACSHINPFDPLFEKHRLGSIISLTCVIIALCLLSYGSIIWGTITMIKYYFLPWLVFSSWLVITTFLHHHGSEENIKLPWFNNEEWSYVVGNLSSVDRNYGILHGITHNIGTHQVHHLFPVIPHYYLKETTKIFQNTYPQFTRESNEPIMNIFISTFKLWKSQYLIDDDTKIFMYDKNRKQK